MSLLSSREYLQRRPRALETVLCINGDIEWATGKPKRHPIPSTSEGAPQVMSISSLEDATLVVGVGNSKSLNQQASGLFVSLES